MNKSEGCVVVGRESVVVTLPGSTMQTSVPLLFNGPHPVEPNTQLLVVNGYVHGPEIDFIGGWRVTGAVASEFTRLLVDDD